MEKIEWEKSSPLPKYILIGLGILILLALLINFLVNLAANFLLKDIIFNSQNHVNFNLSARVFPYPKIGVNNLVYKYQDKPVLSVGNANLGFSFFELFKGRLHIYSINFSQVLIDLTNFPKPTIHESTNKEFPENYKTGASFLQEKKPAPQTTIESTFLGVDSINLEDINIIYSSSPEYFPLHFKLIKIDRLSSGKAQFQITANSDFKNIPFKAAASVNLDNGKGSIAGELNFAENKISFNAQYNEYSLVANLSGILSNPADLETLTQVNAQNIPSQFTASLRVEKNQMILAPIQIQYPNAVINADFSLLPNMPISANISIPEGLLNQLAASTSSSSVCPLNHLATDIIKGLKLNIVLTINPTTPQGDNSPRKTLIQIAGTGISLEEGVLPANLQQTLSSCFDYQLQDKTIRKTIKIGSEPEQP